MTAQELSDKNFEQEVLKNDKPVLVDFWAEWCGPCRMQAPVIDDIAKDFSEKVKVGKLEVDQNPEMAQKYSVMSIPMIILFKGGEVIWQGVGLQQKKALEEEINKVIGK